MMNDNVAIKAKTVIEAKKAAAIIKKIAEREVAAVIEAIKSEICVKNLNFF